MFAINIYGIHLGYSCDVDKYYLGFDVGCKVRYLLNEVGSWQMVEVISTPLVNTVDMYIISVYIE